MSKGGRGNRQGGQDRQEPATPATTETETTQSPGRPEAAEPPAAPLETSAAVEPEPAPELELELPAVPVALTSPLPSGWVRCRAVKGCLVRGVFEEPGKEFWLEPDLAERLKSKGALEQI